MYSACTSTATAATTQAHFSSLATVHIDATRQRMPLIKVGIVGIRCPIGDGSIRALAAWIACGRLALLTGWFGKGQCRDG